MLHMPSKTPIPLSTGALDFGSSASSPVVVVENINRNLASGSFPDQPMKARIQRFLHEIDHALLYSVLIMVCAFIPLFSMTGPEGELFGPMAQTYAFALESALLLPVTLTPLPALFFFKPF